MPNWCSNHVTFQGDEASLLKVMTLFREAEENQCEGKIQGFMPDFVEGVKESYFFEIFCQDDNCISYETKWADNTDDLVEVVKHIGGVSFEVEYSESGCGVYGRDTYNHETQELVKVWLTHAENDLVIFVDEDNIYEHPDRDGFYFFEGEYYECKEEALDIVLQRKINNQ
jgi:hypothetical protein